MNFPRVYRRLAVAAIAALVIGLTPSVALAGAQDHWFGVQLTGGSTVAGSTFDVTVRAYTDSELSVLDTTYSQAVDFLSTDPLATAGDGLPGGCTFTTGVCTILSGVILRTAGSQTVTVEETGNTANVGTSDPVVMTHAGADNLVVTGPATATAGTSQVYTVTVVDTYGNTVDDYATGITVTSTDTAMTSTVASGLSGGVETFNVTLKTAGGWNVGATSAALTDTTQAVTVSHGAAHNIVVTGPSTATAGLSGLYTATVKDSYGNLVDDYATGITITSTDGAMTSVVHDSLASGVETFDVTLRTAGSKSVGATSGALTNTPQAVTVSHAGAANLVVTGPATATAGTSQVYTVTVVDAFGNTVTNYATGITVNSTDTAMTSTVALTLSGGVETFNVTLKTAGSWNVGATSAALTDTPQAVTVSHSTGDHLVVTGPATATAGTAQVYTVTVVDAYGNTVTNYGTAIVVTSTDTAMTSTVASGLSGGVETFNVTLKTAGSKSVGATSGALTNTPQAVTVSHATAANLVVTGPATATAGTSQVYTVTVVDSFGNTVTNYATGITVTSTDTAMTSTVAATLSGGVETFNVTLKTVGNWNVGATSAALTDTTQAVAVSHGAAANLVVTGSATTTAGTPQVYTVTVVDGYGNTITDYAAGISVTSTDTAMTSTVASVLSGGVETFNVTLRTAGSESVGATSDALTDTPQGVTVSHTSAANLVVTGPATATAGASGLYTVTVQDTYGNTVTDYAAGITVTSTDVAMTSVVHDALASGVETFDVTLRTAGSKSVGATSAALTDTPQAVVVSHTTLDHLAITTSPTNVPKGAAQEYTVTAADQYGNAVTDYSRTVTISTTDGDPSVVVPTPATLTNGVGTFSVTLFTLGPQTVTASDGVLPQVDQAVTVVSAQIADKLVITGPSTASTDDAGDTYTVTAKYADGSTVTGYNLQVNVTSTDLSATLPPPASLTDGVGTFVVHFGTTGAWTVTAHDANVVSTQLAVNVTAFGPATKFLITGAMSTAVNVAQVYTVKAQDTWSNPVTNYAGTVKITSSDSVAILPANSGLAGGTGTFSVTFGTAGSQSVIATDTVSAGVTSTLSGIVVSRVSSTYHPIPPIRLVDTRTGNGGVGTRMKVATPVTFHVGGRGGITAGAVAVTVNVTVVHPSAAGTLYLGPVGIARPGTYTIAFNKNDVTAYGSTIALSPTGTISGTYLGSSGTTDLVLDVTGFFTPDATGDTYHPLTPVRLLDTRPASKIGLSGKFVALKPREFLIRGRGGVPSNAKAVTGNLTVVNSNNSWAVYLGDTYQTAPSTSTINFSKGQIRANSLTVILSPSGTLWATFLSSGGKTTDLVFDVTGYYTADLTGAEYVPLTPVALVDTRVGSGITGKVPSNTPKSAQIIGRGGVPTNASGVTGIVSVVNQTNSWAVFVGPEPTPKPLTSALNFLKGDTCSNGFTIALSNGLVTNPAGWLSVTYMAGAGNNTNVIVFITGYFVPVAP